MIYVVEVEFPPKQYPVPGMAPKTRLWMSRSAISVDQAFYKRKRVDALKFWNKIDSCCRVGLNNYSGTVLKKEKGYDGVFRFGIRLLNYRFYGFFHGTEFIVPEADEKPGDMGPLQREACERVAKIFKGITPWVKVENERYNRPAPRYPDAG